jgi:tetratricopeptide (TPR) repeat protein
MTRAVNLLAVIVLLAGVAAGATNNTNKMKQDAPLEAGRRAYESSEYIRAVQVLQQAADKEPKNAEIQLLLAKAYYEMQERDAAINSAERAVALDPKNSNYHEWLGKAYGEKAEHSGMFSALSLARKTHKEFEMAVQLDERNFSAVQALIEFDCSAPGIAGGGEDKAKPLIERLAGMDAAEGHYAAGNCRRQKKDFVTADAEFTKALQSNPKSADLIYDIGDYAVKRSQPERLVTVADAGEKVDPADPRGKFYRGVALILQKQNPEQAEPLLREYLKKAPIRTAYPRPTTVHEWLGILFENENQIKAAQNEFQAAVNLDPKNKTAHEALKRLEKK